MTNEIILKADDRGNVNQTVIGALAHKLFFRASRGHIRLEDFYTAPMGNNAWVITADGVIKAAETTREDALKQMTDETVLLVRSAS